MPPLSSSGSRTSLFTPGGKPNLAHIKNLASQAVQRLRRPSPTAPPPAPPPPTPSTTQLLSRVPPNPPPPNPVHIPPGPPEPPRMSAESAVEALRAAGGGARAAGPPPAPPRSPTPGSAPITLSPDTKNLMGAGAGALGIGLGSRVLSDSLEGPMQQKFNPTPGAGEILSPAPTKAELSAAYPKLQPSDIPTSSPGPGLWDQAKGLYNEYAPKVQQFASEHPYAAAGIGGAGLLGLGTLMSQMGGDNEDDDEMARYQALLKTSEAQHCPHVIGIIKHCADHGYSPEDTVSSIEKIAEASIDVRDEWDMLKSADGFFSSIGNSIRHPLDTIGRAATVAHGGATGLLGAAGAGSAKVMQGVTAPFSDSASSFYGGAAKSMWDTAKGGFNSVASGGQENGVAKAVGGQLDAMSPGNSVTNSFMGKAIDTAARGAAKAGPALTGAALAGPAAGPAAGAAGRVAGSLGRAGQAFTTAHPTATAVGIGVGSPLGWTAVGDGYQRVMHPQPPGFAEQFAKGQIPEFGPGMDDLRSTWAQNVNYDLDSRLGQPGFTPEHVQGQKAKLQEWLGGSQPGQQSVPPAAPQAAPQAAPPAAQAPAPAAAQPQQPGQPTAPQPAPAPAPQAGGVLASYKNVPATPEGLQQIDPQSLESAMAEAHTLTQQIESGQMPQEQIPGAVEQVLKAKALQYVQQTGQSAATILEKAQANGFDENDLNVAFSNAASSGSVPQSADGFWGFVKQFEQMDPTMKAALVIGLPVGLMGIASWAGGEGGMMGLLAGAIGLGAAGTAAYQGNLGGAGDFINNLMGGNAENTSGGAGPMSDASAGADGAAGAGGDVGAGAMQNLDPAAGQNALDQVLSDGLQGPEVDQILKDPAMAAAAMKMPQAELTKLLTQARGVNPGFRENIEALRGQQFDTVSPILTGARGGSYRPAGLAGLLSKPKPGMGLDPQSARALYDAAVAMPGIQ